jgi:hypothetical protein
VTTRRTGWPSRSARWSSGRRPRLQWPPRGRSRPPAAAATRQAQQCAEGEEQRGGPHERAGDGRFVFRVHGPPLIHPPVQHPLAARRFLLILARRLPQAVQLAHAHARAPTPPSSNLSET